VIGLRGVQARECGDIGVLCAVVVGLVLSGILWIWRCWLALFSVVFFDGRFRRRVCSCWYVEFWFGFIEVIKQVILEMDVYCARFWLSWCSVFGVWFWFSSVPSVSVAEFTAVCPRFRIELRRPRFRNELRYYGCCNS